MDCLPIHLTRLNQIDLLAAASSRALETRDGRIEGVAIARAGLVLLCGYFEGFIRDLLGEAIDRLNNSALNIMAVPPGLLCSVIEEHSDKFRRSTISDFEAIGNIFRDSGSPMFKKDKLAKTGGNPTVDTIETLFGNFGIPEIIDKLTVKDYQLVTFLSESQVSAEMRSGFSTLLDNRSGDGQGAVIIDGIVRIVENKWLPRRKRRIVGYVSEINELLKLRNRIAHGEGDEPLTNTELSERCVAIRRLSEGLHDTLERKIQQILATP